MGGQSTNSPVPHEASGVKEETTLVNNICEGTFSKRIVPPLSVKYGVLWTKVRSTSLLSAVLSSVLSLVFSLVFSLSFSALSH